MSIEEYVIQRWLDRGIRFFRAVTRNPIIRGALFERGLTNRELKHGWDLYSQVLGFDNAAETNTEAFDSAAADAMAQIDDWDAPNYNAMEAVLAYRLPAVYQYLFDGVAASTGPEALVGVERLLDRYQALKAGNAPDLSKQDSQQAVELLAARRILNDKIEGELRALIRIAKAGAAPVPPPPESTEERDQAFIAYHHWINEWREVARATISRRDYQISLGLASRRSRSDDDEKTREENGEGEVAQPAV